MSSDLNLCINDVFIYNENNDVITDNINCMHDYYPTSRYVYSNEKKLTIIPVYLSFISMLEVLLKTSIILNIIYYQQIMYMM